MKILTPLFATLAIAVLACASLHAEPSPTPQRIVTLGAAVTETVFALGAGDRVVARDASSVYPEAARALPDVGYFRTIGAEGVLALRPDLILAAHGSGPPEQLALLRASTIPLHHFDQPPGIESTLALINTLGTALDREAEATALVAALQAELAAAVAQRGDRAAPRVLFLLGAPGASSVSAAGDRTAAAAFLALCGATNAVVGQSGYRTISAEGALGLNPDFVLVGLDPSAPAHTMPEWLADTPAGRAGRVFPLPLSALAFGPRLGEAVRATSSLLYPAPQLAQQP
jgi:iron complex transport system substrate-binding protein